MILVLSPSYSDVTTDDVLDWLEHFGARWLRLNGEEVDGGAGIEIELRGERVDCRLSRGGAELRPSEVTAVWHRGWLREWRHEGRRLIADPSPAGERLQYDVKLHLTREGRKSSELLLSCFDAGVEGIHHLWRRRIIHFPESGDYLMSSSAKKCPGETNQSIG